MRLKTLTKKDKIILVDYSLEEYRNILREKYDYVLECIHDYGEDYGGSQCDENRDVTYKEIGPELILVENGHFCGVVLYKDFDCANGSYFHSINEDVLYCDNRGTSYSRSGSSFSNDDHSRWDYTTTYLTKRIFVEESEEYKKQYSDF